MATEKPPVRVQIRVLDDLPANRAWQSLELLLPQIEAMATQSPLLAAEIKAAVKRGEHARAPATAVKGRPKKVDDLAARALALADDFIVMALYVRNPTPEQIMVRKSFKVPNGTTRTHAQRLVAELSGVERRTVQRASARLKKAT